MGFQIIYENDTELAEFEAFNKGYRGDVIVVIGEKKYKLYITSMVRLQQDFESEQEYYGYYMAEPNTIFVKNVTKTEIEDVITHLYCGNYFERLECLGFEPERKIEAVPGLTEEEITTAETLYGICFPKSLRGFLMEQTLPPFKGFYNWRDTSEENVTYIKNCMKWPIERIKELAEEIEWCESWGEQPKSVAERVESIWERAEKAPKLIPVFAHRYMPMVEEDNPPVLSVHGTDIIYYGETLEKYLEREFSGKCPKEIDLKRIKPIPFWSEIM